MAPVERGECIELNIETFANDGRAVARVNGISVFVEDAVPGESGECVRLRDKIGLRRGQARHAPRAERTARGALVPLRRRMRGMQMATRGPRGAVGGEAAARGRDLQPPRGLRQHKRSSHPGLAEAVLLPEQDGLRFQRRPLADARRDRYGKGLRHGLCPGPARARQLLQGPRPAGVSPPLRAQRAS